MKKVQKNFIIILIIGILITFFGFSNFASIGERVNIDDSNSGGWKDKPTASDSEKNSYYIYAILGLVGLGICVGDFVYKSNTLKKVDSEEK